MNFRILHYDTVDSTNDLALEFAREGAAEGTVVAADYQTHGRGRFKRRWVSPRGAGLLFSIVLRPTLKTSAAPILTHWAAQSIREILQEKFALPATLKRPNDVLVGGKKIAGILTEARGQGSRVEYVVLGVGLNVNTKRQGLLRTATSIFLETGKKVKKDGLLEDILGIFKAKCGSGSSDSKGKELGCVS